MDEIFDYIKSTKISKKTLAQALIFTELLGILTLIWFLKVPLYQKFLIKSPKSYSLLQMNNQTRYLVSQGDYIAGQANPGIKIVLLIRDIEGIKNTARIFPNELGIWNFQLPRNLDLGTKTLTTAEVKSDNDISNIKNYRIRILPDDLLSLNTSNQPQQTILEDVVTSFEEINLIANNSSSAEVYTDPLQVNIPEQAPLTEQEL